MNKKIEEILIQSITNNYHENKQSSIVLMTDSDFRLLLSEINTLYITPPYEQLIKGEKRYMGLKIYITEDLSKGEIIVK